MSVLENYRSVVAEVAAAAVSSGREPASVFVLPVSKTFPPALIRELYDAGVRDFGENRAEEMRAKAGCLPSDIRWHFVGRLQSNKVRRVLETAAVIHSVDSLSLLERIDRISGEIGVCPEILLEVNISGESSKTGLPPDDAERLAARAASCSNLKFSGFMTMAPAAASELFLAALFERLVLCAERCRRSTGLPLSLLSMGMSGDFRTAVRHGSTLVRIGTAVFGGR